MVSDVQLDSVRREVVHVDLMRVDPDKDIVRLVPVTFSGRSIGVFKGGKLKTFRRHVKVAAKPASVPVEVAIDITAVDGGESIRIKDIDLGDAQLVESPEQRLCFVAMPKATPAEEEEATATAATKEKGKKK
jgi:large subunit ribosomal protein L25